MKIDRKSDILGGVFLDLSGKRAQRHANDFASFLQENDTTSSLFFLE